MLRMLSRYGEIVIIDGNHDININNPERESLIYSTIENINSENKIKYLRDREKYEKEGIVYGLTPMYEKDGEKNKRREGGRREDDSNMWRCI